MKNRPFAITLSILVALSGMSSAGCKSAAKKAQQEATSAAPMGGAGGAGGAGSRGGPGSQASRTSPYGMGGPSVPMGRNPDIHIPRGSVDGASVTYSRVKISEPYLAITFDDGPHPSNTPRLLDMLAQRNIKATFFVVGTNVESYPAIMRRMINEGHEVGNHTRNHSYLTRLSDSGVVKELNSCRDSVIAATGVPPLTMRPPYGAITSRQKSWIYDRYRYPAILWSVDRRDWQRPGSQVVADRLVSGARSGAILLAHDIHKGTIDAMPQTLDRLLAKGYRFVTVTQLLRLEGRADAAQASVVSPRG
ncbi:MAG: polysaccharide deacetylase family protein [Verrucomicrobiales bacterium]